MAFTVPKARGTDRKGTTYTIVMLGHSHWLGYIYGQWAGAVASRYVRGINPTGRDVPTILNKAVNGQLIANFTARVGTDVTPFAPAACIVDDPTNDLGTARTTVQLDADYRALITALRAVPIAAANIVLVNQCMSGNTFPEANIATVNGYNDVVAALATSTGVSVMDVRSGYVTYRLAGGAPITDDGIHPTIGSGAGLTNKNGDLVYGNLMLGQSVFT